MIALIQRVTEASVTVEGKLISSIESGLLVLWGIEKSDTEQQADQLVQKVLSYRVFSDENNKMNLSLKDTQKQLLIVPQFTLAAQTTKGLRPSFSTAAPPSEAKRLFNYAVDVAKKAHPQTQLGQFGADMQVKLVNDGPVTFWLHI